MTRKQYPTDILELAQDVQNGWTQIGKGLAFGPLDMDHLVVDISGLRNVEQSMSVLEKQLTELRNQRDALAQATWDKVKRVRAGVKSFYGDDSSEYELVGGKRLSERKPRRRTASPAE